MGSKFEDSCPDPSLCSMNSLFLSPSFQINMISPGPVPYYCINSLIFIYVQGVLEKHQPQNLLLGRSSR